MSNPSLGQIVNLCLNQKMNLMYVVEKHKEPKLVNTNEVLELYPYPDVEVKWMMAETYTGIDCNRSVVCQQTFKVFI